MRKWHVSVCSAIYATLVFGCSVQSEIERRQQQLDRRSESYTIQRIEEYSGEIERHRDELQAAVQAAGSIANFNKLLAIEYLKAGMFGLALDSLQEALLVEPNNEILFYLTGISAMQLAKVYQPSDSNREQLIERAEYALMRSAEIKPDYGDPLLAISVLYIFERQDADGALPYLERLRDIEDDNPHVHALLGRVYTERNQIALATEAYRRASELYENPQYRQQSLDNIEIIQSLEATQ